MSSPRRRLKLKSETDETKENWKRMLPPKPEHHKRTREKLQAQGKPPLPPASHKPFRLSIKGQRHYYVAEVVNGVPVFNYGDAGNLQKAIAIMKEFNAKQNIKHKNGKLCVVVTNKSLPLQIVT